VPGTGTPAVGGVPPPTGGVAPGGQVLPAAALDEADEQLSALLLFVTDWLRLPALPPEAAAELPPVLPVVAVVVPGPPPLAVAAPLGSLLTVAEPSPPLQLQPWSWSIAPPVEELLLSALELAEAVGSPEVALPLPLLLAVELALAELPLPGSLALLLLAALPEPETSCFRLPPLPPDEVALLPPVLPLVASVSPLVPPVALASPLSALDVVAAPSPPAQSQCWSWDTAPPVAELSLSPLELALAVGSPEVAEPPPLLLAVLLALAEPPPVLLALLLLDALPEPSTPWYREPPLPPVEVAPLPPVLPEVAVVSPVPLLPVALAAPLSPLLELLVASPPEQSQPWCWSTAPPVDVLPLSAVEFAFAVGSPEEAEPPGPLFDAVELALADPPPEELAELVLDALPEPSTP